VNGLTENKIFNNRDQLIEGWYWAYSSKKLKKNQIAKINFLSKELAIYRGADNVARAMEAYCPHMGAHLGEGKVEGNGVRCFFHHWKFSQVGELVDIPCQKPLSSHLKSTKIKTFPCAEKYGLIWIYTGEEPQTSIPEIFELQGADVDFVHGNSFQKKCHPSVVMINAIDAQHFSSVHQLPVHVNFEVVKHQQNCIQFNNITKIPQTKWYLKYFAKFYREYLTYSMCYWNASTGSVTIGPDFLHFYIIFALRPTTEGYTEGQTILVTKKFRWLAKLVNPVILYLTKIVGNYFAKGDTKVFETIQYSLRTPIKEDFAIIEFIKHTEKQKTCDWGTHYKRASYLTKKITDQRAQYEI
jgi:phenylpropionate dioxygenase-like ring-hydroxylating dioxygenase large terminal subunit